MNFALYLKLVIYTFVYSIVFIMMSRARAETVRRLQLLEMIGTKKTLQSDDGMHWANFKITPFNFYRKIHRHFII